MPDAKDLLAGLNPEQKDAVSAPAGPVLVLAGAGSGKTRVITHRIGWIVRRQRAPAAGVLAVTFTNKAAREMRSRIASLLDPAESEQAWAGTFHAFSLMLLRRFPADAGLRPRFPVYGEPESRRVAKGVAEELRLDPKEWSAPKLRAMVSRLRTLHFDEDGYEPPGDSFRHQVVREAADLYEAVLDREGAVDFDDLLIRAIRLLAQSESAKRFAARRCVRLLVDEYQDTSPLQHRLIRRLAPHGDVFAVGDDDQSIYAFRGADHRNILRFREDYPNGRVFRLEANYRSTPEILGAANAVIARNHRRHGKTLRAVGRSGEPIRYFRASSAAAEGDEIAGRIAAAGPDRGSVAVLVRTRAQTRAPEQAFVHAGIPHRVVGGLRFYERREVQDVLAWVRLLMDESDDRAFLRALGSVPRGFGPRSVDRVREAAGRAGVPLLAAARKMDDGRAFRGAAARGLGGFLKTLDEVAASVPDGPLAVVDAVVNAEGDRLADNDHDRRENLASLVEAAGEFEQRSESLETTVFLDQVSLLSDEDMIPDTGDADGPPPVLVMTVHAAKGLEFDAVFLAGLAEGLFPHQMSSRPEQREEERRLFYVGLTRARRRLTLSFAPAAMPWIADGNRASSFISEIPSELLDDIGRHEAVRSRSAREWSRGDRVLHPRFGVGQVESVDANGYRLTALFRAHGRKTLILKYARLRRA